MSDVYRGPHSLQPALSHKDGESDPRCAVCTYEYREVVERAYVGGEPISDLAGMIGCDRAWVDVHGWCMGLLHDRIDNTVGVYGRMINHFLNNFERYAEEITPNVIIQAAKQLDLISGRTLPDMTQNNMGQVVFHAVPEPVAGAIDGFAGSLKDPAPIDLLPVAGEEEPVAEE